jgi:putative oxidoreductase
MMVINQHSGASERFRLGVLADEAIKLIQTIAQPSLVQLVMRLALAVPFWKSGILKWDGFGRLNDTAVTLFTDEFMLHLPGGPYHFPAPSVMAFLSGTGEILFPVLLVLGLGTRFAALGLLFMTGIVELTVPIDLHLRWAGLCDVRVLRVERTLSGQRQTAGFEPKLTSATSAGFVGSPPN